MADCIRRIAATVVAAAVLGCGPNVKDAANLNSTGSNIICLGDSITRGYGASSGMDYPSQLSALLGRPVVNAGVDGDTTAEALARLSRDVLEMDPWIVIVELGGNDLLNKIDESETRQNLDEITRQCVSRGAIVVLVHAKFGILLDDPYIDAHKAAADAYGALLIRNALSGILGNPSRMSDQVHPNDSGYALLAERIAEIVEPMIAAAERTRK